MTFRFQPAFLNGLGSGYRAANNPRILYGILSDNLESLTSTSSHSDYPVGNLLNPATYLYNKSTTSTQTLQIKFAEPLPLDAVAIAGHNLHYPGSTLRIALGESFDQLDLVYDISDIQGRQPIVFHTFQLTGLLCLEITLDTNGHAPAQLSNVFLGEMLTFHRRIWIGHSPLKLSQQVQRSFLHSYSGEYAGATVKKITKQGNIRVDNLPIDFYEESVQPFIEKMRDRPFIFAHRPLGCPQDVHLCWSDSNPAPTIKNANFMEFNINVRSKYDG